jgi:3-oxoacyl-[acyl-carrier protein] reductase
MKFQNKVAIVTGGTRGIGYQIARKLADEGANVIAMSRGGYFDSKSAPVNETASPQQNLISAMKVDVSSKNEIDRAFQQIYQRFGRIDILVNNAGICETGKSIQITEEQWDRMLAINLKGVFFCCQAVYQIMADQKYGKIVNITSVAAKTAGIFVGVHYSISKAGVILLTKQFAKELASSRVNVNAVAPGLTETSMNNMFTADQLRDIVKGVPLGRLALPEEIANAALFLASDDAAFITGEVLDINGGILMD